MATGTLLAALFLVDRAAFSLRETAGSLCAPSPEDELVMGAISVSFSIARPCFTTGMELRKGSVYRFKVEDKVWQDGGLRAGVDGLEDVPLKLVVAGPFRRHVGQPWMKLVGRVGRAGSETFAIGSGLAVYKAERTVELFLYVTTRSSGRLPDAIGRGRTNGLGGRIRVQQMSGLLRSTDSQAVFVQRGRGHETGRRVVGSVEGD